VNSARRLHWGLGALVCVILPGASWLDGSGRLAYSMFADVCWYRVDIVARDDRGAPFAISPTEIGRLASPGAALWLGGADQFHVSPRSRNGRAQLGAIARFACTVRGDAATITITLSERDRPDGAITTTVAEARCR
jgi:hypothetical protein